MLGVGSLLVGLGAAMEALPAPPSNVSVTQLIVPVSALSVFGPALLLVFSPQFTGRIDRVTRPVAGVLLLLVAVFLLDMAITWTGTRLVPVSLDEHDQIGLVRLLASFGWSLLTLRGVIVAAAYLVVARLDGPARFGTTVGLVVPAVAINVCWRFVTVIEAVAGELWAAVAFAAVPAVSLFGTAVAVVDDGSGMSETHRAVLELDQETARCRRPAPCPTAPGCENAPPFPRAWRHGR